MPTAGCPASKGSVVELADLEFDASELALLEQLAGGSLPSGDLDSLPHWVKEPSAPPAPPAAAMLRGLRAEQSFELDTVGLWLKLPRVAPGEVPWECMRDAITGAAAAGSRLPPGEAHLALSGYVAPGCTLVGLDLLLAPGARTGRGPPDLRAALKELLAADGPTGHFLRGEAAALSLLVRMSGPIARGWAWAAPTPSPRRLPPLQLLAALPSAATRLNCGLLPPVPMRCRFHGQWLHVMQGALAAPGAEGVALLEAAPEGCEAPASPRPLLLVQDAAIVKELAAWASQQEEGDSMTLQHAESALIAAGHALRPGCDPSLMAFAAVAALRLGWSRLGTRLVATLATAGGAPVPGRDATVLHACAASGVASAVQAVLAGGMNLLGGAAEPCLAAHVATPLHAACLLADPQAVVDIVRLLTEHDPAAVLAWSSAQMTGGGCAGATPSSLARAHTESPEVHALNEHLCARAAAARRIAAAACAVVQRTKGVVVHSEQATSALMLLQGSGSRLLPQPHGGTADAVAHACVLLEQIAAGECIECEHVGHTAGAWQVASLLRCAWKSLPARPNMLDGAMIGCSVNDQWRK
jgi:hypothetical protein